MTVQSLEASGRISLERQVVEHTTGAEDTTIAGREHGGDDDDIDDVGSAGNTQFLKGDYERTAHVADFIPWIDGHDDTKGEDIENQNTPEDFVDGFLDGGFRIVGFAGGDADDFNAQVGVHDHDESHQGAADAIGEEAAIGPEVCDAGGDAAIADTENNHAGAADDHEDDGADLDQGEPEFKFAIG